MKYLLLSRHLLLEKPRHNVPTPAQPTAMEHTYQDVIRGPPAEREPERAARNAAIAFDAGTNVGSQDHNVESPDSSEAPEYEDLSRAQTQHRVETLPQHGAALIDYALRDWSSITQGSTTTDGWVNRWFFDMYIVHFPSNLSGWAAVAEPEVSSLPAVSHMQDYSDATEYRLCDWTMATDRATTGQRVCKHMFDALIAQCNPRIRRFQDAQVFPHGNVSPSCGRQPAGPARTHGPLSMPHSVAPSVRASREPTPRPSHADGLRSQRGVSAHSKRNQERSSRRSRGNILDHDSALESPGRRTRSRSPDLIARPRLDHDRDHPGPRRQRDVSLHYSDGGMSSRGEATHYPSEDGNYHEALSGIAPTHNHDNEHPGEASCHQATSTNQNSTTEGLSPEPGHIVPHGTGLPDPEFQREKNEFSICCHCWTNNRPCDHQWPCRGCRAKGIACAYIVCPMSNCSRDVKCPAYHILPEMPKENRKLGSPVHLVALLGLNRRIIESYDVRKIQRKIEDPGSAQQIYLLLQKEIEQAVQALQSGEKFEDPAAKEMLRGSDKVPAMGDKALRYKASMIVKLVQQLRNQPYKELWKQFHRQQRFGPTARD
ncbi:hypothetical protein KCU95_g8588, partial [Aureobasidium melanogenum]